MTTPTWYIILASVGLVLDSDGSEKIESDDTDLTISSGAKINLTATSDVHVPANVGLVFGNGEKIEGDDTDLTVTSGGKINLTATSDVHIPANVGLVLDTDGSEKIESDDTNMTISVGAGDVILALAEGQALRPSSNNEVDLGSSSARFANIYTGDLDLTNDRGSWTLIEEEDFISFRNNKTGKRFAMVMEDITGRGNYGPGNDGRM